MIGRCLTTLSAGAAPGELDIVVVCNGCVDRTAEIAHATAPEATVVELPVASKSAALNAGDERARHYPRIYLDADVDLSIAAVRALTQALLEGALCAAPIPHFDLVGRPRAVRDYYRIWAQLPYLTEGMVGTGVYALSAAGRARFDTFPPITADDQFVLQQFAPDERCSLPGHRFVVHPPMSLRGLVAIRRRAYRGTTELADSGLARQPPAQGAVGRLLELARTPANWLALLSYVTITIAAKAGARWGRHQGWERDDSARILPPVTG